MRLSKTWAPLKFSLSRCSIRRTDGKRSLETPNSANPMNSFVTVCGDGEYIIYTALAWRNKSFGQGQGFAWAADSNTYAIRDANATKGSPVRVYRNFKERAGLIKGIGYTVSGIWGGALLCVKGSGFICFYDWESGMLVRRIEVDAVNVCARIAVHKGQADAVRRSSGQRLARKSRSCQRIRTMSCGTRATPT